MNNADSALYAALKSLGTRDGALTTALHVYWVVQKVPRIAFYFTQSATTGFIASVFPSRSRVSFKEAFAGPELCDWKLSRTVLRGLDSSNGVRLLGKIERLIALLRSQAASRPELAEDLRTEANYFEDNKERMRYPKFRKLGFFVGSGVIEAGCKTVLGRLKRSGMFWTVRGANAIIALRCCKLSGRFEEYWEARRA
jgi:hypothetical protein